MTKPAQASVSAANTEPSQRIAVLITCFNRKDRTLESLKRLFQFPEADLLDVYLLDDGSRDGTGEAVRAAFPNVQVFDGDGSYFWSRGTRFLFEKALAQDYRAYLWLNDDNELFDDALTRLLYWLEKTDGKALLAGSMVERDGKTVAYGGNSRYTVHPMRFRRVTPSETELVDVDCLNGNFLLIPREVAKAVGNVPIGLVQQGADFVYSLRAHKLGFGVQILPGYSGVCATNNWGESKRGIQGLRRILRPRHLPFGPTCVFYREMSGPSWPFWIFILYAKAFFVGY